ncbi:60s ribosomal protein l37 protein [Purpureocillium lavendulum]|uniref:60s ribosomal protein l37 protein n=1 Tax=Purpureocillium lavendulum TaxID=1247861 RepID=A0AB34FX77_9HYPO|nr:60s ribosomal protein l37 protein [Purpureocillium lavendulum]
MTATRAEEVLEEVRSLQPRDEFSIIRLRAAIASSAQQDEQDARQRGSDVSNAPLDGPTPASLQADLAHYKELFAKLRFSYVEQVTKEKFIRAIVGDPPQIVTMQENLDLERETGEAKAQLKSSKLEVEEMVEELGRIGRELSAKYECVYTETARLEELPERIRELEAQVEELRAAHDMSGAAPGQNLPLAKTLGLVAKRKAEQQELARELEALQSKAPRKRKEADRLRAELQPLEARLHNSTAAAREAQRRKEAALGGAADDLDQRARWWRANEGVLRQALDVKE